MDVGNVLEYKLICVCVCVSRDGSIGTVAWLDMEKIKQLKKNCISKENQSDSMPP